MLPVPTVTELAAFTGRPEGTFGPFADEALTQAALMFTIATKLTDYPDDPDLALLARYAIMEMGDRLLLEQPYQSVKAGPFQTETIGSYSYSRITQTTKTVQQGLKAGLFWWDTAIDELLSRQQLMTAHGSIKVHEEGLRYTEDGGHVLVPEYDTETDRPPYIRIS